MIQPVSPSRPAIFSKGFHVLCAASLCALCVETSAAFTPETAAPDAWAPFTQNPWIEPGSALDFSAMRGTDAPAGCHGRVIAVGNHFEFEGLPGVPQRFYGINLCFGANYPETPEDARRFAANLARMGYNAVRIHHHDGAWAGAHASRGVESQKSKVESPRFQSASRETNGLRPETCDVRLATAVDGGTDDIDRLDALAAACIENGLYLTTDLYVSRRVKWRDCGIDRDGDFGGDDFKRIVYAHEGVFSNYCAFARAFFSHRNPYTGRTWAEEPALGWISLVNEDAIGWDVEKQAAIPEYQAAWRDFLARMRAEKGGAWNDVPDAFPETADGDALPARAYRLFIGDLWVRFTGRVRGLLDALGCRALVTSLNGGSFFSPEHYATRAAYDYCDIHFYVDHPAFLGKSWSLPARVGNADFLVRGPENRGVALPLEHRLLEKPFAVTEFDYCFPNPSRGGGALAAGALASLQDTDALWRFCWSHKKVAIAKPEEAAIESFDVGADPLRQAAERLFVALFLRRDVSPLHRTLAIRIPPEKLADVSVTGPTKWGARDWCRWMGWFAKVGVTMSPELPPGVTDGGAWPEVSAKKYRDSLRDIPADALPGDGQVGIDWTNGVMSVSVPRTCAVFGPSGILRAGALEADIGAEPATVWATALDGETLADARRILVGHLRDVKNSGMEFEDETCRIMNTKGSVPLLARKATIRISLEMGDTRDGGDISVWRLDQTGRRLGQVQVPAAREGGKISFDAETVAADGSVAFFHEISR